MYAVIFTAKLKRIDRQYKERARLLREVAINHYGCLDVISRVENDEELTISYWKTLENIEAWRNNTSHRETQDMCLDKWFSEYKVQVVEVLRNYSVTETKPEVTQKAEGNEPVA